MPNLIGTAPNQVPVNGMLGTLAFQDGDFWLASPLKLLATVTPTAAAHIDFLNTFTSTYDNYLIVGNGINFSLDDGLSLRVAVAGAADIAANYIATQSYGSSQSTAASTVSVTGSATVRAAGKGCNFQIDVLNANDTSGHKLITFRSSWNSTAGTTNYTTTDSASAYVASNAVTGVRLFSTLGGNFSAVGKVRVYGYANT